MESIKLKINRRKIIILTYIVICINKVRIINNNPRCTGTTFPHAKKGMKTGLKTNSLH